MWMTQGLLDPEYKEYILLAWLQQVKADLGRTMLYPSLAHVIRHHRELTRLRAELERGKEYGTVTGIDWTRMQFTRTSSSSSQALESYLFELISRALPHLTATMEDGKDLYDLIDDQVEFSPIGVQPLNLSEGYLLVTRGRHGTRHLKSFRFTKSRIERGGDAFLELQLKCLESRRISRLETPEGVKWNLMRNHRDLPQPAVFHAHLEWEVPLDPTLLPIARRRLLREIAQC